MDPHNEKNGYGCAPKSRTNTTGNKKDGLRKLYSILNKSIIALMVIIAIIVAFCVGVLEVEMNAYKMVKGHAPHLIDQGFGFYHHHEKKSFALEASVKPATSGFSANISSVLTTSVPVATQTAAQQYGVTNCTSSPVSISGTSVMGASSMSPITGASSEFSTKAPCFTVTVTVTATKMVHGSSVPVLPSSAIPSLSTSATDAQDTGYTSTTTVVADLTSYVTVTKTVEAGAHGISTTNPGQAISSAGNGNMPVITGISTTVQSLSHATSTTIFRTVTSIISGIGKTVTVTKTLTSSTSMGMSVSEMQNGTASIFTTAPASDTVASAVSGALVTPAASANTTWNSTYASPLGPASATSFPQVSSGSKPKAKGGNSGNGTSGGSCILMLVAIAVAFSSL